MFRLVSCLILSAVIILFLVTPTADVKIPEPIVLPIDFFWATAYSMGEVTRSGLPVDMGIVAVDPAVIPLGSVVHVEGYGYAYCADTGGAIKGKRIDVYMASETEALKWGRRQVEVRVIRRGD